MKENDIARAIKALALEMGFVAVGITLPGPPAHLDVYTDWLEQGCHGEMAYLAEPRRVYLRSQPGELLPGCQSIIVLAARYAAPPSIPHPHPLSQEARGEYSGDLPQADEKDKDFFGRVAAYAWGNDYHFVLRQRMEAFMQRVQEKTGRQISYRCFTDSAPILERELAQRAGLGWIGKNTCLIHPRLGSYLFLAEIFTDLALPPDPPFLSDRCGTCRRCLEACPTRCILPNRTIDARRCISYLTIEHQSAIPAELRPSLQDWVFGCDICQQVCPWNRRVSESASFPEFQPRPEQVWLSLTQILTLTRAEFNQKFRHTPLLRPKWRGLSRNASVVLGNLIRSRSPFHVGIFRFLQNALQDHPDSLVRQHLAWSLAQLNLDIARQALKEQLQKESDPLLKAEVAALLE